MLKRLLVPLDGTRMAEMVLPITAALAAKAQAQVTLLHVLEQAAPATVHGQTHLTSADDARRYLERIAAEAFPPGVTVDWHVHHRPIHDVAHSLADHADEFEPDLIAMTPHGHRTFGQRLFGTVPQQVVRRTPTPVLLVQPGPEGKPPEGFQRIVVPLDGRPEHEVGLPLTVEIAKLFGASVRMVTVVPTQRTLAGSPAAVGQLLPAATAELLDLAEEEGVDYLARQVERLRAGGVEAAATIDRGNPTDVLPQTILRCRPELVALGTHGTAGVQAFWEGSMGQRLLGRIPASFLLVPAYTEPAP